VQPILPKDVFNSQKRCDKNERKHRKHTCCDFKTRQTETTLMFDGRVGNNYDETKTAWFRQYNSRVDTEIYETRRTNTRFIQPSASEYVNKELALNWQQKAGCQYVTYGNPDTRTLAAVVFKKLGCGSISNREHVWMEGTERKEIRRGKQLVKDDIEAILLDNVISLISECVNLSREDVMERKPQNVATVDMECHNLTCQNLHHMLTSLSRPTHCNVQCLNNTSTNLSSIRESDLLTRFSSDGTSVGHFKTPHQLFR